MTKEVMQQAMLDEIELVLTDPQSKLSNGAQYALRYVYQQIQAITEAEKQEQGEILTWKNAAIRLGEELSSVGPDGYYDMTPEQWLDWGMSQSPQEKNYLVKQEQGEPNGLPQADWECYSESGITYHGEAYFTETVKNLIAKAEKRGFLKGQSSMGGHDSDCALHREPAYPAEECNCSLKNRLVKQEQDEPVGKFAKFTDDIWREVTDGSAGVPLYTHPKEWVGLTNEDMSEFASKTPHWEELCYLVETKLKEKNA